MLQGQSGMWHACTKGHAEVVSELLSHGGSANDADEDVSLRLSAPTPCLNPLTQFSASIPCLKSLPQVLASSPCLKPLPQPLISTRLCHYSEQTCMCPLSLNHTNSVDQVLLVSFF